MKKSIIIVVSLLATSLFSCKKDVITNGTPNPTYATHLKLTFTNIANAPVSNVNSVSDWNAFFATATNATTPFQSITVVGNEISLDGGYKLTVKDQLFANNKYLQSIDDDSTISNTGYSSFYGCTSLKTVNFNALDTIGIFSFYTCDSLLNFTAPNVRYLGLACFQYCMQLQSVSFHKVTTITNSSFFDCLKITNIDIPNATSLEEFALYDCANITTANFPLAVTLGATCLGQCAKLTTINLQSCGPHLGATSNVDVFFNTKGNNIHIYIPTSVISDGDIDYLKQSNTVLIN